MFAYWDRKNKKEIREMLHNFCMCTQLEEEEIKAQLFKIHAPSSCCSDIDVDVGVVATILRDEW